MIPPVSALAAAAAESALPRIEVVGPTPAAVLAAAIGQRIVGVVRSGTSVGTTALTTPLGSIDVVPSRPLAEGARILLAVRAVAPRLDLRVLAVDGPAVSAAASRPGPPSPVAGPVSAPAVAVRADVVVQPARTAGGGLVAAGTRPAGAGPLPIGTSAAAGPGPAAPLAAVANAAIAASPSPPVPSAAPTAATTASPPVAATGAVSAAPVVPGADASVPLPAAANTSCGPAGGPPIASVAAEPGGEVGGLQSASAGSRPAPLVDATLVASLPRPSSTPTTMANQDGAVVGALAALVAAWRAADAGRLLNEMASVATSRRTSPGDPAGDETRLPTAEGGGGWRHVSLPLMADDAGHRMLLLVRDGREDTAGDGRDRGDGRRFLVDLSLSRLGRLQLDGWVAEGGRRLDLCVRSERPLPAVARDGICRVFHDAADVTGLSGGVSFRAGAREVVTFAVAATRPPAGWLV